MASLHASAEAALTASRGCKRPLHSVEQPASACGKRQQSSVLQPKRWVCQRQPDSLVSRTRSTKSLAAVAMHNPCTCLPIL